MTAQRHHRPTQWALSALLAIALLAACASAPRLPRGDGDDASSAKTGPRGDLLLQRIVLVGDAGELDGAGGLLESVAKQGIDADEASLAGRDSPPEEVRTVLVYLGDNVYESAAELLDSRKRAKAEAVLDAQLRAGAHAREVVFVAGNHDWADGLRVRGFDDAIEALGAEEGFVARPDAPATARLLPRAGCPGPVVEDWPGVRFVAIDSAWWLQPRAEREAWSTSQGCPQRSEDEVEAALRSALACVDATGCVPRIVVAHHPMETYGSHGGWFPWYEHLVCGGALPLPGLCSLYISLRRLGVTRQDTSHPAYRHYVSRLERSFRDAPPLVFAAGHEHTLQVHKGRFVGYELVSGSGSKKGPVGAGPGTLFAHAEHGFMVLEFFDSGRVTLGVHSLDSGEQESRQRYRITLRPGLRR